MRSYRQLFALITLFCLLFELCEPSTNFIRTSVSTQKQERVLKIQFHADGSTQDQDQGAEHDHGPNLKNFETHVAQIAASFQFEFTAYYVPTYNSLYKDVLRGGYSKPIFQPPKAA